MSFVRQMNVTLLIRHSFVVHCISSRGLKLVAGGDVHFSKPPIWDYMGGRFSHLKSLIDPTVPRFNENTKLFTVEGNIAVGKASVASKLAKHLGFTYFPDPTEDDIYLLKHHKPPFDLRMHNFLLPDSAKYYTGEMFWNDPDPINKGKPLYLQYNYYLNRHYNYAKSLCSLFNTGRGSIVDNSPFSDIAFSEAMYKCGYLSEKAHRWFCQVHGVTARLLWKPHLIIYLRSSNDYIREQLKKRNIPWEMNGINMTDKFLTAYTEALEKSYLSGMNRYSQILTIDTSNTNVFDEDEIQALAYRVTEVDFECSRLLRDDYKLLEWRMGLFSARSTINNRALFSNSHMCFTRLFNDVKMPIDMYEGRYPHQDSVLQLEVLDMDPRTKLPPSFNTRYTSLFDIMFNPFLLKRNYAIDRPKDYLWK